MLRVLSVSTFLALLAVVALSTTSYAQWYNRDYGYYDDYNSPYERGRRVVRCESEDFSFNRCPVRTDGDVRLVRQLSDTPCRRGENWGYDRRGIWVDDGCAAEFRVRSDYARGYDDDRWRYSRRDDDYREGRRFQSGRTIRCESEGFEHNRCPADTSGGVTIARQLSDTECRQGQNWGYDQRGIWVDNGCAAEFRVAGGGRLYGYRR